MHANSQEGDADEPRMIALRETLRLYVERSRDVDDADDDGERADAARDVDALRKLARAVTPGD